jgi:23S rRNA (cytidine1920-2'-O)/16S rRNA (cytidine1409-2'-O)-methyltransferase
LPNLFSLLKDDGIMMALVKPQFEVGRGRTRKGIVRDPALHVEVLRSLAGFVGEDGRMGIRGAAFSPIRGAEGNIEFIFYLEGTLGSGCLKPALCGEDCPGGPSKGDFPPIDFERVVREAHELGETDA